MEKQNEIKKIEQALLAKHPNWSQEKAGWLAQQALGIINWR